MREELKKHLGEIIGIFGKDIKESKHGTFTLLTNVSFIVTENLKVDPEREKKNNLLTEVVGFEICRHKEGIDHIWVSSAVFSQGIYKSCLTEYTYLFGRVVEYVRKDDSIDYGLDPISTSNHYLCRLKYVHSNLIKRIYDAKNEQQFFRRLLLKPIWELSGEEILELKKRITNELDDAEKCIQYLLNNTYKEYFESLSCSTTKPVTYKLADMENIRTICTLSPYIVEAFKKMDGWMNRAHNYIQRKMEYEYRKSKSRQKKKEAYAKIKSKHKGFA